MKRTFAVTLAAIMLATTSPSPSVHAATDGAKPAMPSLAPQAKRGLAFAQEHCAACHGVSPNAGSPNPEAPPFDDIANRAGVTQATMQAFLRDSHNFPVAMNFTVAPGDIRDLAAYFASRRRSGYRPSI